MANIIPYREFLKRKELCEQETGITVSPQQLHPSLFDWQKRIVTWACKVGRAAIWADTGLGKTRMQLEWLRQVCAGHGTGLILAPLAVCQQTIREGAAIGMEVRYVHDQSEVSDGFNITNYERVPKLDVSKFNAVVLDEASILKQSDGKTRKMLIDTFRDTKYRLACTATPAPNDPEELCNQAEFLGYATRVKMLATYFVHDGNIWRLKGHAVKPMMRWMSQWAIALRKPSDIGGDDAGYELPGLNQTVDVVEYNGSIPEGQLFAADLGGVGGRARVRKETLVDRVNRCVDLVNSEPGEQWIIWAGLNDEADMLNRLIPGSVNVKGSMSPEDKAKAFLDFADGNIPVLITNGSMASFGLNWQNCARMAFCGLNDSWESYYQSIRRCYRFGQKRVVDVHVVVLRVTKPGRIACVHVQQVVTTKTADGVVGLTDFRGDVIRAYVENGWIFHGEVTVNKNPQAQAIRTKAQALMFVTKNKDSSMSRPALADYLLMFRKPGDNQVPIKNDVSNEEWIDWAQPVWWNIRETNTLNERLGREDTDERHICPLQLDFIERCIRLWSNKGELVFDPFGGIGSTVYEAIKLGRKGMSIELKPSYWDASVNLMRELEEKLGEATLF